MRNIINDIKKEKIDIIIYETDWHQVLNFLIIKKIDYEKLITTNNYLKITIKKSDYKKISKYYKTKISSLNGIFKIKAIINKYKLFIFCLVLGIILIFFLSNIIISIKISSSDKEIQNIMSNELENYGIKRLSYNKSYKEKEKIKKEILNKHKNELEWIEFEKRGMTLIVHIEKRIIKKETKNKNKYCHVIASKDGLIKNVKAEKGTKLKDVNDYVKKGDILISGEIKKDEEIKKDICAKGEVYATVWYSAYVKIPRIYKVKKQTSKKRYNLKIKRFDQEIIVFKNKFEDFKTKNIYLFHFFNLKFYLQVNYNNKEIKKEIKSKDENKMILLNIDNKFKKNLKDYEYIEKTKVLKKVKNNSTIEAEVFLSVYKKIGKTITYEREGEVNDRINS